MARVEIETIVLSTAGVPVTGASVQVNFRGSTPATVYVAATGGTTASNPITTTLGTIPGWLDPGSYDLVITDGALVRTVHLEAVGGLVESRVTTLESTTALSTDVRFPAGADIALSDLAAAIQEALHQTGDFKATAVSVAPTGWLLCDGAAVSRATYAALFTAISTTYGAGDGSTTFNLPDLRGRVPVGVDGTAARLTASDALGQSGGAEKHTLTTAEIPAHTHGYSGANIVATVDAGSTVNLANAFSATTTSTGGGGAHNNMQPYQIVNWLVKT